MTDRQPSTRSLVSMIGLMVAGTIDAPGVIAFLCGFPFLVAVAEELYVYVRATLSRFAAWRRNRAHYRGLREQWQRLEAREAREDPTR